MADEDSELKDTVQRLHRYIVDALRAKRDDPFASPVTVAEIYQQLAPYRTVRSVLGFEMNADYEHALTRLLAGLDGLTLLEPAKARERLEKELDSPNPDVGMYREFAACEVTLNPSTTGADWVREQLEEPEDEPAQHAAPDWTALAELDPVAPAEQTVGAADPGRTAETTSPEVKSPEHATCSFCASALPPMRNLRFCPFCGGDQSVRPCAGCGEALEPDWAFCVACGTPVASGE
jgi:hypothetical protein